MEEIENQQCSEGAAVALRRMWGLGNAPIPFADRSKPIAA